MSQGKKEGREREREYESSLASRGDDPRDSKAHAQKTYIVSRRGLRIQS